MTILELFGLTLLVLFAWLLVGLAVGMIVGRAIADMEDDDPELEAEREIELRERHA